MKHYKPTTPGRRGMTVVDYSVLTTSKPEKSLVQKLKKTGGRGHGGRVTVRHRGGGHKRRYRRIDFKRCDKPGVPAKVVSLEYDPNRSSFIALLTYKDGEKRYVLAPQGLKLDQEVVCQEKAQAKIGNRMQIKNIPAGSFVYNIELAPKRGGQIVRSAGNTAQLLSCESGLGQIKLPSGEIRLVKDECFASIGQLSNPEHGAVVIGKAGRKRLMGKRPKVRGSAMNPCDHPHGGGENRQPVGLRKGPKTPWGKLAYGRKTRKKKKKSNRFIVKRRVKKTKK